MASTIEGTTIYLTRGDTFRATITITDSDGDEYTPVDGDVITFTAAKSYTSDAVISKDIDIETMILQLDPADTADLGYGKYVYDIQIDMSDGTVDTFIDRASLVITEEVTQ